MLAAMSESPASWHPDPMGRHQLRYWDGKIWTDHVSNNGVQATDALQVVHHLLLLVLQLLLVGEILPSAAAAQTEVLAERSDAMW